jgi:F420H(2)-dependent quinone reductase
MTTTPGTQVGAMRDSSAIRPPRLLIAAFKVANAMHCAIFRASGGRIGGSAKGIPLLLLTTTGRRSGRVHVVPVGYIEQGDDLLVVGSAGGFSFHPAWYLNVRQNPRVSVETPGGRRRMLAEVPERDEQTALWKYVVGVHPVFESYQRRTKRRIGVVRLRAEPPRAETKRS